MDARIHARFPKLPPMVAYAAPATFRVAGQPSSVHVYAAIADQVASFGEFPGPPVVVFHDLDDPVASATFGAVMATTYKSFGAVGLITSGAGRDLDQVEVLAFPCFSDGTICAHGYCHIVQINVPVHVGGVMVQPGDLLHGDRNGVTTIPKEIAGVVAEACPEFMAAEAIVLDCLKQGGVDPKKFAAARKQCHERIEALARKLKS